MNQYLHWDFFIIYGDDMEIKYNCKIVWWLIDFYFFSKKKVDKRT